MIEPTAAIRIAVECLTSVIDGDLDTAADHITKMFNEAVQSGNLYTIVMAQLSLNLQLVLMLARQQGAADLARRAREILQELSPTPAG
jgi:hypothetical protein